MITFETPISPIYNYLVDSLATNFPENNPGEGVIMADLEHSNIVSCCKGKELLEGEEVTGDGK